MADPNQIDFDSYRTPSGREMYTTSEGQSSGGETRIEPLEAEATPRSSSDSSDERFSPLKSPNGFDDDDGHGLTPKLTRRRTEVEIPDQDRHELEHIFSTLSRQQSTLAAPGDPKVDPSSPEFDLTKFLKLFRHQLEHEGM